MTKQIPILQNVNTRIDVLDLVDGRFAKVASVFLLGDAAKHVKSVKDINTKNKALAADIGINAIKSLMDQTYASAVTGGDDWDELEDIDIEELLNTEIVPTIDVAKPTTKKLVKGDIISDRILYSKDKFADVSEKIALATNIKPYKQYLWMPNAHRSLTEDEVSLMSHYATAVRIIDGYPVDGRRSMNVDTQSSIEQFTSDSVLVLSCVSLDSLVSNKSTLQMIGRSDAEPFELIYTNTIQRFFPLLSYVMLMQYLSDESQLETKYEELEFDNKEVEKRYRELDRILPELNKQKPIAIDSSEFLTITTTGMILTMPYRDQVRRVNTVKLFQAIDISTLASVAMLDLYRLDLYRLDNERRPVRIRKLPQRDQYRLAKDDMILFSGFYSRKTLVQLRAIVITLLPRKEYDLIIIIVDQYGTIWIKTEPSQMYSFSKAAFLDFITPIIDPIIKMLNAQDSAFVSHEMFPLLADVIGSARYNIVSSSSKITFKFPVDDKKLLDLLFTKFLATGLMAPLVVDWNKRYRAVSYFEIRYGVSRAMDARRAHKIVEVKDTNGIAMVSLSNLDMSETALYIDLIGRLIIGNTTKLTLAADNKQQLSVIDPILYRPRVSSDMYSRICQKRFQPVLTTADDPKGVEYRNFTFNRPEYYKCPSKDTPILGVIRSKHEKGYCLPCCRKTKPTTDIKAECIAQTDSSAPPSTSSSTYKIDYPIHDVPNSKIMSRRIAMPTYIEQLLDLNSIVANGSILTAHSTVQDGMDPTTNSFLQTAIMIASIKTPSGTPMYKTYRELIIDIVAMIKQPISQVAVMQNKIVSDRFVTPQALIHAIEDQYLKLSVLEIHERLSAMEWNDIIIYLANCMGLNVLLLADDRSLVDGIRMMNLFDVDGTKPIMIILRRINLEWSSANHNTRALYLPITTSTFKVQYKVALLIERLDTTKSLPKIRRVTNGRMLSLLSKQFTIERIQSVISQSKHYKLISDITDQKLAVIGIGKGRLVTTIATMSTTVVPELFNVSLTASLSDMLSFITDYNEYYIDDLTNAKDMLASYKLYLQAALKRSESYEFVASNALLLKISRFIIYENMAIGAVVNLINVSSIISTELMFFKPISLKSINAEVAKLKQHLQSYEAKLNAKAILCYPAARNVTSATWYTNPLTIASPKTCKLSMTAAFNAGSYTNEIYHLLSHDVIEAWRRERSPELDAFMIKRIKSMGAPPYVQTKVDSLCTKIATEFSEFDIDVVRPIVGMLFEKINSIDRTVNHAIDRYKANSQFTGFSLKNVHRMTRPYIRQRISSIMKDIASKTSTYPSFDLEVAIVDQRDRFYKGNKLLVHTTLYADLADMLLSDLTNPFRRDYIINAQLTDATLSNIRLHLGELIYVQRLSDK